MSTLNIPRFAGRYRLPNALENEDDWQRTCGTDIPRMNGQEIAAEELRLKAAWSWIQGKTAWIAPMVPTTWIAVDDWVLQRLRLIADERKRRGARQHA